jgi:hypothetical protein
MQRRARRYTLAGLNLFLALNAIYGAIWVVPGLPREWLVGTPFADYTIPAVALGVIIGSGALVSAVLVLLRPAWGCLASIALGAAMMIFEIVETSVVGWDLWLHAFGVGPITKGLSGADVSVIPAPLGIPLPLWQQPIYFVLGGVILALGVGLRPLKRDQTASMMRVSMRGAAQTA